MIKVILIIISLFVCTNQLRVDEVEWYENNNPGIILDTILNDDNQPFEPNYVFEFDKSVDDDIKSKFHISDEGVLSVFTQLDREERKEYKIMILIKNKDNPEEKLIKELYVIVLDENDNEMEEGESSIKILKVEGTKLPDMEIGRVFVNDLDDDDLKDKNFRWSDHFPPHYFKLDEKSGMIKLAATVNGSQIEDGEYSLNFSVIEKSPLFDHSVTALVNISVKSVSEEAVRKSGSIRFHGITVEHFMTSIEILRNLFVDLFKTKVENIEIITISQKSIEPLLLDVRFYVKSYDPELMKIKLFENRKRIENAMNLKIQMINIDECASMICETSCYNKIMILPEYIPIITNQSSFYGINTFVQAQCGCETLIKSNESVSNVIGFKGNGYAIYSGISHCNTMNISLNINSNINSGTILYIGPMDSEEIQVGDSIELLLQDEFLKLTLNYGSDSIILGNFKLPKQKNHSIEINYQNDTIELVVKDCHSCPRIFEIFKTTKLAKLSYPIQLGGIMEFISSSLTLYQGFFGCISNFKINGEFLNVMTPILQSNISYECLIVPGK